MKLSFDILQHIYTIIKIGLQRKWRLLFASLSEWNLSRSAGEDLRLRREQPDFLFQRTTGVPLYGDSAEQNLPTENRIHGDHV